MDYSHAYGFLVLLCYTQTGSINNKTNLNCKMIAKIISKFDSIPSTIFDLRNRHPTVGQRSELCAL